MNKKNKFPKVGRERGELNRELAALRRDDVNWRKGRASLHVYYPGDDVLDVAREAYTMFMIENGLAPAAFPSLAMMEREVVGAAIDLLNGSEASTGFLTSGGTESIFLAVKAARDWKIAHSPRAARPLELLLSRTAHPAFDKAAHYLGVKVVRIPTTNTFEMDVRQIVGAVNESTMMLVASSPNFPFGSIDPVAIVGQFGAQNDVWVHVDACIGGFLAPFARKLGYPIPDFDLAVPGVRSLSADLHKFGYAAKGASLLLYSHERYAAYQGTEFSDWPKGKYFTPTFAGTRPGGAIAAAWAVVHYLGESGYMRLAERTMRLWDEYILRIKGYPELTLLGSPNLAIVSFTSATPDVDIMAVADELARRKWYMSRLAEPYGIHQIVNLAHERVVDQYFDDVADAIRHVRRHCLKASDLNVVTY